METVNLTPEYSTDYNPQLVPGSVHGNPPTILARDMVMLLMQKMSPQAAAPFTPKEEKKTRWSQYKSTKDFCRTVFNERYDPQIEHVMDVVDQTTITIVKSSNGYGKSHASVRIGSAFFCMHEQSQVYTAAAPPETNLDTIMWGQLRSLITQHPEVFSEFNVSSGKFISRKDDPLSYIIGVPIPQSANSADRKAKFSGKHAPFLMFILDEGDAIPFEIYEAIESCMSGGFVRLVVFFNPRADVGPLSRMEKNGIGRVVKLNALDHQNVVTGEDIYPGAVTRNTTVRRMYEWSEPLREGEKPDAECYQVPEYLVGFRAKNHAEVILPPLPAGWRRVTNPAFSYMVLAEYPAVTENQLISRALVENAQRRWREYVNMFGELPVRLSRPTLGGDIAEYGVDDTVFTLKYGSFVPSQKIWRFVDVDETATRGAQIYKNYNCSYANIDGNGVGAGVAPRMTRLGCFEVYGLKVQSKPDMKAFSEEQAEIGEFGLLRDYLYWGLREWLQNDPQAMIPDDEMLGEELYTVTYSVDKGKLIKVMSNNEFREKLGRSADRITSLALANCPRFEEIAGTVSTENYAYGGSEATVRQKSVQRGNYLGIYAG